MDEAQRERRCAVGRTDADRRALARRAAAGELIGPYRNLYARSDYWRGLQTTQRTIHVVRALALLHPDWVFAGLTAATIHGFDHSVSLHDGTVSIASPRTSQSRDSGRLHRIRMVDPQPVVIDGLAVTGVVRTLLDCGSTYDFEDALALFDSAVRQGIAIDGVLAAACSRGRKPPGSDVARLAKLCEHADGLSENGGESKVRALIILNGFLRPQLQRRFENPDNPLGPYRTDFSWDLPDGIIVAEYDGMTKYTLPQSGSGERRTVRAAVHAERRREDHLRAQGVTAIVRLEFEDLLHPERLVRKLVEAGVPRTA
ncbi:CTP synthase [Bifidobacterium avesanii]|nr:CTP synthase [Bifidobacterium avesanii]